MTWQEELDNVLDKNNRDRIFGKNIDWDVKDVRKFIKKLEKLGCSDFHFPDYETITFILPLIDPSEALLFIMTDYHPSSQATYYKKKNKLSLEFRY